MSVSRFRRKEVLLPMIQINGFTATIHGDDETGLQSFKRRPIPGGSI